MSYNANDIVSLSQGKAFRTKIGMYLSADRQEAINLGLRELIVNVQDEYEIYKPQNPFVKVTLNTTMREITVEDNMRGIPVGMREDGINSLTAAMLINHSGAKHNEGAYASAIGINGVGNKVVCHTAKELEVQVKRDGKIYVQKFQSNDEGAHPITEVVVTGTYTDSSGTRIRYIPDEKVYEDKFVDIQKLKHTLKETSYFTKGLNIILIVDGVKEVFVSHNGLIDGLSEEGRLFKPFSFNYDTEDCRVELALQWVKNHGQVKGYANGLYMPDGGAFISGFKSSLTRTFNSLSKKQFDGDQVRNVLDGFVSVKVKMGQFSNQAKTALANPEARTAASAAISAALKEFASQRQADFEKVVEMLTKVEKAEAAAEKARQAILNNQKTIQDGVKKKTVLAGKLLDCKLHGKESELIICEGLSASGSLATARDSNQTAIMPLRGKLINTLKNDIEKVMKNEEIQNLNIALGCGQGKSFNINKLRYGKIIIAADMDKDGYSIMCLILTFFYCFYPELIHAGKIYWGKTPLFKVKQGKNLYYAYNEEELRQLPKGEVTRAKGIGELNPIDFKNTLFSENKQLVQFTMEDAEEADYFFNMLLGEELEARRDYIFEHVDFSSFEE